MALRVLLSLNSRKRTDGGVFRQLQRFVKPYQAAVELGKLYARVASGDPTQCNDDTHVIHVVHQGLRRGKDKGKSNVRPVVTPYELGPFDCVQIVPKGILGFG